jgi:hypothetical protein
VASHPLMQCADATVVINSADSIVKQVPEQQRSAVIQ